MNQIYFIDVYNLSTNDILKIYYVVQYNKIYYYMFDIGERCLQIDNKNLFFFLRFFITQHNKNNLLYLFISK